MDCNRIQENIRRADVVDRDLSGQRHPAAAISHRVTLRSLDKEIALARIVIGGRNRQRVEITASDIFLDPVAVHVTAEELSQRRGVEKGMALPPPSTAPKERSRIQVMELRACVSMSQREDI